jgi:uncharacterized protein YqgV (UPF0045/DUF77 family)
VIRAEFSVYPFVTSGMALPAYVQVAIDELEGSGFRVEVGPLGNSVVGELQGLLEALCRAEVKAIAAGALRIVVDIREST